MRPTAASQSEADFPAAERFIDDASSDPRFYSAGDGCRGRPTVHVYQGDRNRVHVGSNVSFGDDVAMFVGGNHRIDWVTTFGLREVFGLDDAFKGNPWSKGDIVVGDGARIGRGTKIMSGVTIGRGAVIRPFSVVVGDVGDDSIVEGCPAREMASADTRLPDENVRSGSSENQVRRVMSVGIDRLRRSAVGTLRGLIRRFRALATSSSNPAESPAVAPPNLTMGHATYFAPIVHSDAGKVAIGSYSSIPYDGEMALDGNEPVTQCVATGVDRSEPVPSRVEHIESRDISIGSDVWIGRGAKVIGGVTIGDGAVVAAYSVVTRDVRPYAIAAGNPAREVARRFDDETVEALLEIKWWTWPEAIVRDRVSDLCSTEVQSFVQQYRAAAKGSSESAPEAQQ